VLAYSVTSIQEGTSGPLALAGPALAGGLSPIPGMTVSVAAMRESKKAAFPRPAGLVRYLEVHRAGAQYPLAVSGSPTTAPSIISTGQPVMAMGGYTGMDPWPSLSAFKTVVAQGRTHYILVGSAFPSFGFGGASLHISASFLHNLIAELKKNPQALSGLIGESNSRPKAVDQWARTHGMEIPTSAYGDIPGDVLYSVR